MNYGLKGGRRGTRMYSIGLRRQGESVRNKSSLRKKRGDKDIIIRDYRERRWGERRGEREREDEG